jgi:hypothetical protein
MVKWIKRIISLKLSFHYTPSLPINDVLGGYMTSFVQQKNSNDEQNYTLKIHGFSFVHHKISPNEHITV